MADDVPLASSFNWRFLHTDEELENSGQKSAESDLILIGNNFAMVHMHLLRIF